MNRLAMITGIAVAIIVSGTLGAYAIFESNEKIPTTQDAKDVVSDIKKDIKNADLGYGQVEKQEGSYSP